MWRTLQIIFRLSNQLPGNVMRRWLVRPGMSELLLVNAHASNWLTSVLVDGATSTLTIWKATWVVDQSERSAHFQSVIACFNSGRKWERKNVAKCGRWIFEIGAFDNICKLFKPWEINFETKVSLAFASCHYWSKTYSIGLFYLFALLIPNCLVFKNKGTHASF